MRRRIPPASARRRARRPGYTLIEVVVAMWLIAAGLLGIAKLQAEIVSSSQQSRARALIGMRATSLGAFMRANPGHWVQTSPHSVQIVGGRVTAPAALASPPPACASACTPAQMAAFDLNSWAQSMNRTLSGFAASVQCAASTSSTPAQCAVQVQWRERPNRSQPETIDPVTGVSSLQRSYVVFVQP